MATQDEDDIHAEYHFLIKQDEEEETILEDKVEEHRKHYLSSIDSTVVIRQIPSQGISFKIWDAANSLVSLLEQYRRQPEDSPLFSSFNCRRPLRVLELGSGTGLVGIAAAVILRANLTITDLPSVLPNLHFNVAVNSGVLHLNGGSVDVKSLRWGEVEDMENVGRNFDIILGSDVVYHDNLYEPLLKTLRFFLAEGSSTVFLMAHSRRWKKESGFFKKARKMFQVQNIHSDTPSHGARIGVMVYRIAGKSPNVGIIRSSN